MVASDLEAIAAPTHALLALAVVPGWRRHGAILQRIFSLCAVLSASSSDIREAVTSGVTFGRWRVLPPSAAV